MTWYILTGVLAGIVLCMVIAGVVVYTRSRRRVSDTTQVDGTAYQMEDEPTVNYL